MSLKPAWILLDSQVTVPNDDDDDDDDGDGDDDDDDEEEEEEEDASVFGEKVVLSVFFDFRSPNL